MKKILSLFVILASISASCFFSNADSFEILDGYVVEYVSNNPFELSFKNKIEDKKSNNSQSSVENQNILTGRVVLGDEQILNDEYSYLIDGKRVGAIVNQTSVNYDGVNLKNVLYNYKNAKLTALYAPEHGIDGNIKAGDYVSTRKDVSTGLPVYSLYGDTREPTKAMLENIDVMLFDLQDIGARTYTYISTMYKSMEACKKYNKTFVVLDRPNPVSCKYVEGFMLEDIAKSFVGIDNMPMAHGMTAGELARYFNRNIGVNLVVIPMKNYTRDMIWQDTGLKFKQTSPYIPDIKSAFGYMATGSSENMGIGMSDFFNWSGGKGINSTLLAQRLNSYNLPGVNFVAQTKGQSGGVRLDVYDYHTFNPAKTGYYIIATANEQKKLLTNLYEKNGKPNMFYKITGNKAFAQAIDAKKSAIEIENMYRNQADSFRENTRQYYLYK
jgi:yzbB like protein